MEGEVMSDDTLYFDGFGTLKWLDPKDFYASYWVFVETSARAEDGDNYSIVSDNKGDIRYTSI